MSLPLFSGSLFSGSLKVGGTTVVPPKSRKKTPNAQRRTPNVEGRTLLRKATARQAPNVEGGRDLAFSKLSFASSEEHSHVIGGGGPKTASARLESRRVRNDHSSGAIFVKGSKCSPQTLHARRKQRESGEADDPPDTSE